MNRFKKIVLIAVAMLLVVTVSVAATAAYLMHQTDMEKNAFSVGKVKISLDQAKVNAQGQPVDENGTVVALEDAARVISNHCELASGGKYNIAPTVYVEEGSEPCLLLLVVYIPKELQDVIYYNGGEDAILTQTLNNDWWGSSFDENYSDNPDEYDVFVYAAGDQIARPGDVIPVFDHILVKEDATYEQLQKVDLGEMRITAYGVQSEFVADYLRANEVWELVQEAFDPFDTNP